MGPLGGGGRRGYPLGRLLPPLKRIIFVSLLSFVQYGCFLPSYLVFHFPITLGHPLVTQMCGRSPTYPPPPAEKGTPPRGELPWGNPPKSRQLKASDHPPPPPPPNPGLEGNPALSPGRGGGGLAGAHSGHRDIQHPCWHTFGVVSCCVTEFFHHSHQLQAERLAHSSPNPFLNVERSSFCSHAAPASPPICSDNAIS